MSITAAQIGAYRPKFGNKKTIRHGQIFDSMREANRYDQLLLLERGGRIKDLSRLVKYDLRVNDQRICTYTADFVYLEVDRHGFWKQIVEDVKGYPNDRWPMKKKLMKAIHGIDMRVT